MAFHEPLPDDATRITPGTPKVFRLDKWSHMSNAQRVLTLYRIGRDAGTDPRLRRLCVTIFRAAGVQPRDYRGQAEALLRWVREHVYFINEADECLQSPSYTLDMQPDGMPGPRAAGDCDDHCILMVSLCTSIHLPVRVVTSGRKGKVFVRYVQGVGRSPNARWTHVYTAIGPHPFRPKYDARTWSFADTTVPNAELGWDVVSHGRGDPQLGDRGDERISGMSWGTMASLVAVSVVSTAVVKRLEKAGWF